VARRGPNLLSRLPSAEFRRIHAGAQAAVVVLTAVRCGALFGANDGVNGRIDVQ